VPYSLKSIVVCENCKILWIKYCMHFLLGIFFCEVTIFKVSLKTNTVGEGLLAKQALSRTQQNCYSWKPKPEIMRDID